MKKISILVPAIVFGALFSAMVIAAPVSHTSSTASGEFPNRADAYLIAVAS